MNESLEMDELYNYYCKSFENESVIELYSFGTEPMTKSMFAEKIENLGWFINEWVTKLKTINLNKNKIMLENENLNEPQYPQLNIPIVSSNLYAKCCFSECMNKAEWFMGTWQCCDECAKKWITETEKGWGYSPCGTSSRAGQEAILKHNLQFNLKHYLVDG